MRLIDADELFKNVGKIKPRNKEHYKSIGEFMNMITNTSTIVIKISEDCSDYYKGYCARHEDGCFHQCKNAPTMKESEE